MTDKRATRDHKSKYVEEVRMAIDDHDSLYLFSYENMRSTKFKNIRLHFRETDQKESSSRIYLGKNKLLQIALGRTAEEEYADNLRHVAKRVTGGSVGLLFTSRPRDEVESYFANLVEEDFARAGASWKRESFPSPYYYLSQSLLVSRFHDGTVAESWYARGD